LKKIILLAATAMLSACGTGDTEAPPADTTTTDTTMATPAPVSIIICAKAFTSSRCDLARNAFEDSISHISPAPALAT